MRSDANTVVVFVIAELTLLALAGFAFVGGAVLNLRHPLFSFSVFGVATIGLFNVLEFRNAREFSVIVVSVVVFYAFTWFVKFSVVQTLRGLLLLFLISAVAYLAWKILHRAFFLNLRFGSFGVWVVLGVVFYLFVKAFDLYAFRVSLSSPAVSALDHFLESARLGGVMGLGIGLGYDTGKLVSSRFNSSPPPKGHGPSAAHRPDKEETTYDGTRNESDKTM